MKVLKSSIALILLVSAIVFSLNNHAQSQDGEYVIDTAHSQVIFKVKHLAISTVTGRFDAFEGTYNFDNDDITKSTVETTIEAASINTNEKDRDDHLRSKDFLNVEQNPTITFKSKSIKKGDGNSFEIIGDLAINGITKEVTLDATYEGHVGSDPWGKERTAFIADTKINRKDYGITWNKVLEAGGFVVGDEIRITLEVEGIRKKS